MTMMTMKIITRVGADVGVELSVFLCLPLAHGQSHMLELEPKWPRSSGSSGADVVMMIIGCGDDVDDDPRSTKARFWIRGGTVALGDSRFAPSPFHRD